MRCREGGLRSCPAVHTGLGSRRGSSAGSGDVRSERGQTCGRGGGGALC